MHESTSYLVLVRVKRRGQVGQASKKSSGRALATGAEGGKFESCALKSNLARAQGQRAGKAARLRRAEVQGKGLKNVPTKVTLRYIGA